LEVRYFRLDRETRQSSVRKLTLPSDDSEANSYIRLAVKAYPELYFARYVILGEGDTERIVIPRIAEAMGIALDPSFIPIVPLGGRYVEHFSRLLDDLQIPHSTLLDLDLGRKHGGAKAVRAAFEALNRDLSENPNVKLGFVDPDTLDDLMDSDLLDGGFEANAWLQTLAYEGIYFAYPIDIDFSMLVAFPSAYRHPHVGGKGPKGDRKSIQEKKSVALKSEGNPSLYDDSYDEHFKWYPYLFLSRSKPETHFAALNRIAKKDLIKNAPPELKALIEHVKTFLSRDLGE
jgi:putative ATP-dependent endonuclease of the OLD family